MNLILSIFFIILSAVSTKIFCILAQNTKLMDQPNERSLHLIPTIRGGGLIFIGLPFLGLPFLCALTQTPLSDFYPLIISVLLLAAVSFLDDLYNLAVKPRFLIQALVASLVAFYMKPYQLDFLFFTINNPYLIVPFLFILTLWAINHFNFMDGLDGFCASQALFLFAAYSLLFGLHHAILYHEFCIIFIGSLIGFLIFNFPPAKLFMGDVGSASLGLIIFCIALVAQKNYQVPIVYWVMLNGLFLFDSTITLCRRIWNKEKWSAPHRKHAYQRLKQFGINNSIILLGQLLINTIGLILVLLSCLDRFNISILLLFQLGFLLTLYYRVEKIFPMFQQLKF